MCDEIEMGDEPTALYRLYDATGELLYVGITLSPTNRMAQHAACQPWWDEVARKTMTWYPTRADASRAETEAIRDEQPKYNIKTTSHPGMPQPGPRLETVQELYAAGEWVDLGNRRVRRKMSVLDGYSA